MKTYLAATIIAEDVPGIVEKVAEVVAKNGGNWLESSMSRLGGKFAGILLIEVATDLQVQLTRELESLTAHGIRITLEASDQPEQPRGQSLELSIMAHDRPGIVEEITALLASHKVNVEQLQTHCTSAPMSALPVFKASATIQLPETMNAEDLHAALEAVSEDLMVELESSES